VDEGCNDCDDDDDCDDNDDDEDDDAIFATYWYHALIGIVETVAKEPMKSLVVKDNNTTTALVEKPNYYEQLRQQMIIDGDKTRMTEVAVISASVNEEEGSDDECDDDDDDDDDDDYDDDYEFDYDVDVDYDGMPPAGEMSESLMIALGMDVTNRPKVESDWIPPTVSGLEYSARKYPLYLFIRN